MSNETETETEIQNQVGDAGLAETASTAPAPAAKKPAAKKPKKTLVKILKNCVPENAEGLSEFMDGLGRLPKGVIVELHPDDAKRFIKAKIASADAAI